MDEEAQLMLAMELSLKEAEAAARAAGEGGAAGEVGAAGEGEVVDLTSEDDHPQKRQRLQPEAPRTAVPDLPAGHATYHLQGIVWHAGSGAGYGHYVADVRTKSSRGSSWERCANGSCPPPLHNPPAPPAGSHASKPGPHQSSTRGALLQTRPAPELHRISRAWRLLL